MATRSLIRLEYWGVAKLLCVRMRLAVRPCVHIPTLWRQYGSAAAPRGDKLFPTDAAALLITFPRRLRTQ